MGTIRRLRSALSGISLVALVSGCTVPVAAALDEADANRVMVALDQSGIDATKEEDPTTEGKYRVMVARDDVGQALATMREEELPRPKTRGMLDAAERGQLVPSQAAEHAQLVAGLAGDLEKTLAGVDGVLAARVHLNLPPREPLRDGPSPKATASVLIEHRGTTPPLAPESIQQLVSGGAPGVAVTDVAVVFVPRPPRANAGRADVVRVGPITVARGSMTMLRIALVGLVAVVVTLLVTAITLWMRVGSLRRARELEHAAARSHGGLRSIAASARSPDSPV